MSTSAGMPSVACSRRIMLMDKLRRRLRTSATRVLVPIIGSSCLRVSFFWLILNLMASDRVRRAHRVVRLFIGIDQRDLYHQTLFWKVPGTNC